LPDVSDIDENQQTPSQSDNPSSRDSSQIGKALSASWLILYNYTAQSSKRQNYLQETSDNDGIQVTQMLCDIQKKLQDIGVSIPTDTAPKLEHMTGINIIEALKLGIISPRVRTGPGEPGKSWNFGF